MAEVNVSLEKLVKRLDVVSVSLNKINQISLREYTASTDRMSKATLNLTSVLKNFGDIASNWSDSLKKLKEESSTEASESSASESGAAMFDKLSGDLLSGELFDKFNDLEILMSGGLTGGVGILSKLADAFALAAGGAGTLSESLAAVFGTGGGIASVVAGVLIGVTNFVDMLKSGFNWLNEIMMIIGIALGAVGAVILGVSAGTAALVAAIVAGVATAIIVVKDNWDAICTWFAGLGEWFQENVITPIVEFFQGLWESVSGFFAALWTDISQIWGIVSTWFNENVIVPVISFFEGIFSSVQQVFEGLWIIIQAVWIVVADWFNENVITPIVNFFEGVWTTVTGFFEDLWEGIKEIWSTVSGWFEENVILPVIGFFAGIWISVSSFFEGLWQDIKDVWKGVSEWFNKNVIEPLLSFFTSLFDGIKQGMVSAMNAVIEGIESGINFIIKGINSIIGGFNRIVSWAADVVEVEWEGVKEISLVKLNRIESFETGGYPENASLFWANEYGVPELVGTVGNKTAVASGTEITGIADAVYSTGQAETTLLASAVNLLQEIAKKDMSVNIGDREIARANYRGQNALGYKLITSF